MLSPSLENLNMPISVSLCRSWFLGAPVLLCLSHRFPFSKVFWEFWLVMVKLAILKPGTGLGLETCVSLMSHFASLSFPPPPTHCLVITAGCGQLTSELFGPQIPGCVGIQCLEDLMFLFSRIAFEDIQKSLQSSTVLYREKRAFWSSQPCTGLSSTSRFCLG